MKYHGIFITLNAREILEIKLVTIKKSDSELQANMKIHYSQPKGFVGRSICYRIDYDSITYGHIVGTSAIQVLRFRDIFFDVRTHRHINNFVNNGFYHIEKQNGRYPVRNFTTKVLLEFEKKIMEDWAKKYGDEIWGFESLIEPPRTGECYRRAGWTHFTETRGYSCRRVGGFEKGGSFTEGKRVWTRNTKPKLIFYKKTLNLINQNRH